MPVFKDRVGDRYGRLVVISLAGKNSKNKYLWLCKCDCGNEKVIVGENLSSGKTKSCGCLRAEFLSKSDWQFKLHEDREKALLKVQYSHLKRRDRNKGFNATIDFETFTTLSKSPCKYCGVTHSREIEDRSSECKNRARLSDYVLMCNGIDRIDSSEGYSKSNCVPCCKFCNTAKNTMSDLDFFSWVRRVYEFNFNRCSL